MCRIIKQVKEGYEGTYIPIGASGLSGPINYPPPPIIYPPIGTPPPPINNINTIVDVNLWLKSFTNSIVGLSTMILNDAYLNEELNFFTPAKDLLEATNKLVRLNMLNNKCISKINTKLNKTLKETHTTNRKPPRLVKTFVDIRPWINDVNQTNMTISQTIKPYFEIFINWNKT
jgi:hypothetical protein